MTFPIHTSPIVFSYSLDGHVLERCQQIRDLRVILVSKLTSAFAHQVYQTVVKAIRMCWAC